MKEAVDTSRPAIEAESLLMRTELLRRLKDISQSIRDRVRRLIEPETQVPADEAKAETT